MHLIEVVRSLIAGSAAFALAMIAASTADAATIRGRIVDATDSAPLADVEIRVDGELMPRAFSDADGHFEFNAPGPEIWIRVSASPRQYLDSGTVLQGIDADAVVDGVDLALTRAARLSGRVLREDGSPVAFAQVALVGPPTAPFALNPSRTGSTDAEGRYKINNVRPGSYVVYAYSSGILIGQILGGVECPALQFCARERITTIALKGFDEIVDVDFRLRPGAILAGENVGADGTRLFGQVTAFDDSLRPVASAQGTVWQLPALPVGRYRLAASSANEGRFVAVVYPDHACPATGCDIAAGSPVDAVQGGLTLVDIIQPAAAELRFPVLLANSARPYIPVLADFRVDALLADPVAGWPSAFLRCYRRSLGATAPATCHLPAGRFRFEARATGWRDQRATGVDCEPAGCAADAGAVIDVPLGGVIEMPAMELPTIGGIGVTVRGDGRTLQGVVVEAYDVGGMLVADSRRNLFGSPATLDLEPGLYRVRTRNAPGYVDRIFPAVPCMPDCDPSAGTMVAVSGDAYTMIEIDLGRADVLVRDGFELFPLN